MSRSISALIARRWLGAKKSHSAITAISVVAVAGIAVATAAIVCVLSVFNGFRDILSQKLDSLAPDITISPAKGKTIADADSLLGVVRGIDGVAIATPIVSDNALVIRNGREMPVLLKGVVADDYRRITSIDSLIKQGGRFNTAEEAPEERTRMVWDPDVEDYMPEAAPMEWNAALSIGVSARMDYARPGDRLLIFAPRREGRVNTANPATSFIADSISVAGVFEAQQTEYDDNYVITHIDLARDLFQYTTEATAIEVKARKGVNTAALARRIADTVGPAYTVRDRLQMQQTNFRMIQIEKWITFLLLAFILVVASFNIVSTLSMLVLDKRGNLGTLHALGMSRRRVGRIFAWESIYVTLIGAALGIALGLLLCWLQQEFGLIRLNGDAETLVVTAYPVRVVWTDIPVVLVPLLIIGAATAWISAAFARRRTNLSPTA